MPGDDEIRAHWYRDSAGSLLAAIEQGLTALGKSGALQPDDLQAVDEFHIRGRAGTEELAALAGFGPDDHVVDVGSGLGGPSRYLAARFGCRVTGIDLTPQYCQVAEALAERVGLADRVSYQPGNALYMPFEDSSFTAAWTQHISMNVADKPGFFREIARVLQVGGRLAVYDPVAGNGEPLTFPVPWAREPSMSNLISLDETLATLQAAGFEIETSRDVTQPAIDWFDANAGAGDGAPPPLGLHLLLGSDWPAMARNMAANIRAGRVRAVQIVARRRSGRTRV